MSKIADLMLMAAGGSKAPLEGRISYVNTASNTSSQTGSHTRSHTVSSGSILSSDALIACFACSSSTNDANQVSSVSIQGGSATQLFLLNGGSSYVFEYDRLSMGFYYISGVTDTSGEIDVDISVTGDDVVRSGVFLYKVSDATTLSLSDTASTSKENNSSTETSGTIDIPSNEVGFYFGAMLSINTTDGTSLTDGSVQDAEAMWSAIGASIGRVNGQALSNSENFSCDLTSRPFRSIAMSLAE